MKLSRCEQSFLKSQFEFFWTVTFILKSDIQRKLLNINLWKASEIRGLLSSFTHNFVIGTRLMLKNYCWTSPLSFNNLQHSGLQILLDIRELFFSRRSFVSSTPDLLLLISANDINLKRTPLWLAGVVQDQLEILIRNCLAQFGKDWVSLALKHVSWSALKRDGS